MASNTAKPEAHSSVVGGSSAEKRLACPASYQLEQKLPPSAKSTSSEYADEGTAMHEAMSYILKNDVLDLDTLEGDTFGTNAETGNPGYVVTRELLETCIYPCMDFFDALDEESNFEGGLQFLVENSVVMPGIPEAFGTADLICRTDKRSIIVDWKFGVGVLVKASYDTEDGVRPNAQLMYYARAAMHSFPHMFEGDNPDWPVDLYIVQPRAREGDPDAPFTKTTVTVKQLEDFRRELIAKVAEAMGEQPTMAAGPHCRFAACKTICPLHIQSGVKVTELAKKLTEKRKGKPLEGIDINWSVVYGELLDLIEMFEEVAGEARTQAHAFLEQGNVICAEDGTKTWKLVDKRPSLKYTDEPGIVKLAMNEYGFTAEDLMTKPETLSPAQMRDKIATKLPGATKKAKEAAAKELIKPYAAMVSSGTTLAPADDNRREFIPIASNIAKLSSKLAALTKQ